MAAAVAPSNTTTVTGLLLWGSDVSTAAATTPMPLFISQGINIYAPKLAVTPPLLRNISTAVRFRVSCHQISPIGRLLKGSYIIIIAATKIGIPLFYQWPLGKNKKWRKKCE